MLGIAHALETFGHLAPCLLCLKQREVYWAALAIGALGVALAYTPIGDRAPRLANVLLAAAFLLGAGVAGYHAGVEWGWWPGPAACSGGATHVDPAALTALLHGARIGMPSCEKPAWVLLGLSMAGWNALVSLGLAGASLVAFFSHTRTLKEAAS